MDAVGTALAERNAGLTLSARLHIRRRMGTVYGLGEDSRRASLTHASWTAKKISMGQLSSDDGILQSLDYVILAD